MPKIRCALIVLIFLANETFAEWNQFQGNASHSGYVAWNYNVENTKPIWSLPLDRVIDDVVISGSSLFVTQDGTGFESAATVNRIDVSSGQIVWSTDLPYQSPFGVSAPAVQGDTVYVHRWGHSDSSGSTNPEDKPALVGLSVSNGTELFATQHSGQWSSGSRPTVHGDAVFAAGGYFGGLDAYGLDGLSLWFANVNQQYGWIPAADAQNVYTYMGEASASPGPSVGRLYIADRQTGSVSYISHPRSTGTRSRSSDDGSVMLDNVGNAYALSIVSGGSTLVGFDTSTSSINWEADGAWSDNPSVANGLIALPEGQSVVFLNAATGDRQWSWDHTSSIGGSVLLTDDTAFVSSDSGVFAVDIFSQDVVWHTPVSGRLAASDGFLYITNSTGIHAFSAVPEPAFCTSLLFVCLTTLSRRRAGIATEQTDARERE